MHQIYPVCHETVYPCIGKRVCAVTFDGRHYYGTVADVRDGRVMLTDCAFGEGAVTLAARTNAVGATKSKAKKKAILSSFYGGYGGYRGYGYGSYWLDLALIATLFLLPFFLI